MQLVELMKHAYPTGQKDTPHREGYHEQQDGPLESIRVWGFIHLRVSPAFYQCAHALQETVPVSSVRLLARLQPVRRDQFLATS